MVDELTEANILILGKKDVGALSAESTDQTLKYISNQDKKCRPYILLLISIPLDHDVKHNLNEDILLPTVIE